MATLITDQAEVHELQQARIDNGMSLDGLVSSLVQYECRILQLPAGPTRRRAEARKQRLLERGMKTYSTKSIIEGIRDYD